MLSYNMHLQGRGRGHRVTPLKNLSSLPQPVHQLSTKELAVVNGSFDHATVLVGPPAEVGQNIHHRAIGKVLVRLISCPACKR